MKVLTLFDSVNNWKNVIFQVYNTNAGSNTVYYSANLPAHAKVVICGGGVIGTSVAFHLAKFGLKDVVLLEQGRYIYTCN